MIFVRRKKEVGETQLGKNVMVERAFTFLFGRLYLHQKAKTIRRYNNQGLVLVKLSWAFRRFGEVSLALYYMPQAPKSPLSSWPFDDTIGSSFRFNQASIGLGI